MSYLCTSASVAKGLDKCAFKQGSRAIAAPVQPLPSNLTDSHEPLIVALMR
jgi:hypothetical protein